MSENASSLAVSTLRQVATKIVISFTWQQAEAA
jgi:hypothetical protein